MTLKIGDEILEGKYRIHDIIGEGVFGKVYLAHDVPLDRRVAVKELRREDWTEEKYIEFRRRFRREAQIGAALKHGSIVDVYTLEPRGDDFYLVMEYVDGLSLAERLEQAGPLPIEETVEISMQLCDGLAAMHDHPLGIVHRDIKPSNILLTSEGRPKITDFGLAQLHGESLRSLGLGRGHPGTPAYMSPEQETSVGYLRPASDIYCLGCVLFEMLTAKTYKRIEGTRAAEWCPEVPGWLDDVLLKMLAGDWRSRYQDATPVKAALETGLTSDRKRRQKLDSLSMQADEALAAEEWAEVIRISKEGVELEPGHTKFVGLLDQARERLALDAQRREKEQEDRRGGERRARAEALYHEAAQLLQRDEYGASLDKLKEMNALDPRHGDPQAIGPPARRRLEEERRRKEGIRRPTMVGKLRAFVGSVAGRCFIGLVMMACVVGLLWQADLFSWPSSPVPPAVPTRAGSTPTVPVHTSTPEPSPMATPSAAEYMGAGDVLFTDGRYEEAIGQYQMAVSLESQNSEAYARLGQAYLQLGECDQAISDFQQALELNPDLESARAGLMECGGPVPTEVSWVSYRRSDLNFSLMYPSTWSLREEELQTVFAESEEGIDFLTGSVFFISSLPLTSEEQGMDPMGALVKARQLVNLPLGSQLGGVEIVSLAGWEWAAVEGDVTGLQSPTTVHMAATVRGTNWYGVWAVGPTETWEQTSWPIFATMLDSVSLQ